MFSPKTQTYRLSQKNLCLRENLISNFNVEIRKPINYTWKFASTLEAVKFIKLKYLSNVYELFL